MEELELKYKCSVCNKPVEDIEIGCECGGLIIGDVTEQIIDIK